MQIKISILSLFLCFSLLSQAQTETGVAEKIKLPNNERIKAFKISSAGNYIAFTSLLDNKTKTLSLRDNSLEILPEEAQLNSIAFSANEQRVFFLADQNLMVYDLKNRETQSITQDEFKSSQKWLWWYRFWDSKKAEMLRLDWNALAAGATQLPAVSLKNGKLILSTENGAQEIDPLDSRYYLSPGLSPDQTKICGVAYGKGAFVCDLNKKVVFGPEKLEAPIWIDDQLIVGVTTKDDGLNIQQSALKVVDIQTGKSEIMEMAGIKPLSPKFSKADNKVYFQTPDGEMYSIKIKHVDE
ncbi:hypothetical protein [Maribellus sediminis]|uniref:hypothetical protein n=1 Tax=Maribellus sediminis TaxID=2696285 RepID=UPI0014322CEC|nr:hypothetical protein [Maribellus sediminis]